MAPPTYVLCANKSKKLGYMSCVVKALWRPQHVTLSLTLSESSQYPHQILISIQHGTHHWNSATDPSKVYALSRGSIKHGDTYLTVAFLEQFHSIGWHQLFMGRISLFWEKAYVAYLGRSITPKAALRWSTFFITSVWEYTRQIWKMRNSSVHGTEAEQATNILTKMKTNIIRLYEEFNHNPNMLLPHHHHLFKRLSLEDHLRQG
jgi:hypothetical protein